MNIFSHSGSCLLVLFTLSFAVQKLAGGWRGWDRVAGLWTLGEGMCCGECCEMCKPGDSQTCTPGEKYIICL